MKQLLWAFLGVTIFIAVVGFLTQKLQIKKSPIRVSLNLQQTKKEIAIGQTKIKVEIADTEDKRQKGLSGKVSFPQNEGMLFVFNQKKLFPTFWMKDMLFSLDIIWISDNKIVKIDKNLPLPRAEANELSTLPLYNPPQPIDYVLEVNAGFSDKNNLKVGDTVKID